MHFEVLNKPIIFITTLGNIGLIWIVICIALMSVKKYRFFGVAGLFALVLNAILGEGIIKNLVQRPRPFVTMKDISILIEAPRGYSFPSGHTSSAIAVMCVLTHYKNKISKLKTYINFMWILSAMIIFSRLYLTVHYLSDILGGIALGIISSAIIIYVFDKYFIKKCKIYE